MPEETVTEIWLNLSPVEISKAQKRKQTMSFARYRLSIKLISSSKTWAGIENQEQNQQICTSNTRVGRTINTRSDYGNNIVNREQGMDRTVEGILKENKKYWEYETSMKKQEAFVPSDKVLVNKSNLEYFVKHSPRNCPNCCCRDVCGFKSDRCLELRILQLKSDDFWDDYEKIYSKKENKNEGLLGL